MTENEIEKDSDTDSDIGSDTHLGKLDSGVLSVDAKVISCASRGC